MTLDCEGSVAPDACLLVFLREREPPPVDDDRECPVVLRHDVTLRGPDGPQVGRRTGVPPDAVQRARRAGEPRGWTAPGCGLRRDPFADRLDLPDIAPGPRVALELGVDGPDGAAEPGEVCRARGEEAQQPPAAHGGGVDPLAVTHHLRLRGQVAGYRLAEDAPLRW